MWEESRLVIKRSVMGMRITDTKLLGNQCGLAKIVYNQQHKDTRNYPVCNSPHEDSDHLLTYMDPLATEFFKSRFTSIKKIEENEKNSEL